MTRQDAIALATLRALIALCRRLRVPDDDIPSDITDLSDDPLTDIMEFKNWDQDEWDRKHPRG